MMEEERFTDREVLAQKLNIHLDFWAAEKWQLENAIFMAERAHRLKESVQAHENAQLSVTLGLQQQELLLANFKLGSALDDLAICQTRVGLLQSELQQEKENVGLLKKQIEDRESSVVSLEAVFADKLKEAERAIQDLEQQCQRLKQAHEAEAVKEKTEAENYKAKVSKELASLLRERDFVWNQLNCMEEDYRHQIKQKDELLSSAKAEIDKLQEATERAQRLADEREVELTVMKVELRKADESLELQEVLTRNSEKPSDKLLDEVNEKEDELRQALKRLDEVRLENENLRVLYAELEAKHNDQQKPDRQVRVSRKDPTTRNLNAELEAAAEGGEQSKRSVRRKKRTEDKSRTTAKRKRSDNTGKRRQARERNPSTTGRKALTTLITKNTPEDDNEKSIAKTSFFSSSFSIPKVKKSVTSVR